jgi:MOSC domain-containing protein YiiM
MGKLLSINVAKPKTVSYEGTKIATGIFKHPVSTPIDLDSINLAGDGQADLIHHGGPDKAICVYPIEHYAFWETKLNRKLEYGAFGENFTVQGMTEDQVCIGDIYQIDDVILQVSQPRQPCFKLGVKYDCKQLPVLVQDTGYSGYYMRVLQEGTIRSLESLRVIEQHPERITVHYVNRILHHDKRNVEAIHRLRKLDVLAEVVRNQLAKRLEF